MLPFYKKKNSSLNTGWVRRWSPEGVVVSQKTGLGGEPVTDPMVGGFLTQLSDEGLAIETLDGYLLGWDALFLAISQDTYASLPAVLLIPRMTGTSPSLFSSNSLTDKNFSIAISGWYKEDGTACEWDLIGPLMTGSSGEELMRPEQWNLFNEIVSFARRSAEEHNDLAHRQGWGRIRKLAIHAGARLDDFLYRSVVLAPEKLDIQMRRSADIGDDRVVEIKPSFEGAPTNWLEEFDSSREVKDRYDIITKEGITQILVTPKVRTVLQEIKRLVGRRMAGTRAQAFLLNPYATLGDDAVDVIDESQFEKAREDAGVTYERFTPTFERDGSGYPLRVGLLIETANSTGPLVSETKWLDDVALGSFVDALHRALARNYQLLAWQGYDLEMQGDAQRHHDELRSAFERRLLPPTIIYYSQVHDLSGYSPRVEGIGIDKPFFSPYIAKKKEGEGWFPENISPMVVYQPVGAGEPIAVPISSAALKQLEESVKAAKTEGKTVLKVSWLPQLLQIEEAANIIETFKNVFADIVTGAFDPAEQIKVPANTQVEPKKHLIMRANIQLIEYEEIRREALQSVPFEPSIPRSIRQEFSLMPHQRAGLAWMQHLHGLQTTHHVRGAVLGDDMGLGKTLQLLALMANLIERNPNIEPMLVVAPVSLLENWVDEANKFFQEGALPMLTAYGEKLLPLRVPRAQIDERLKTEDGLVKFLRPNWVGTAKVVLTTYETLRDFEFSFAAQKWSLMICDEAQRIKNPAAMVTRAAKKQNVAFKIACTGTPVENTLADMWCLFDFIQPGLLGALNDFGNRYRKPIEAKTDEEKARVEELRARISPQILRRMKAEVVSDLPKKIVVEDCRKLPMSNTQHNLYAKAINGFKKRGEPNHATPFKNHLGLLQYLRLICTDPRPHGLNVFKPEPTKQYREKAPKLDWLLTQLKVIQSQNEKVIVFCEFREIQRLLQYYIEAELEFRPDIINGDTSASANHTASRQKRIKAFQAPNGFSVLILSPLAVGFGVNIQAANHVIHYTRNWNPAKEDQATDRAYRIGQKKDVYVYYPVVCAQDFPTFDVTLDLLLAYKRSLAEDMLNGSGDVNPGDFALTDVMPAADAEEIDQRVSLDMALRMDWKHFECLTSVLWSKRGYECYRTPGSNDNGVDVVALKVDKGQLVQAKTSGTDGAELNWDAVKEVVGGEAFYKRRHPFVKFDKVCFTNQFFNRQAKDNAALNSVELLDQTHLGLLLEKHIVTMHEVEKMLFVHWHERA